MDKTNSRKCARCDVVKSEIDFNADPMFHFKLCIKCREHIKTWRKVYIADKKKIGCCDGCKICTCCLVPKPITEYKVMKTKTGKLCSICREIGRNKYIKKMNKIENDILT